jgi:hypothetical protein
MRQWRWLVVVIGVALLCSLPIAIAHRPVPAQDISLVELQQAISQSGAGSYEGLFESRGGLRLPDLGRFDDEVAPFTQTSRVRVWYADPLTWRADELLIGAERSIYRQTDGLWSWDSGTRRIVYSPRTADEPLRIPRLMDLNPAEIGRRIVADTANEIVTSIEPRWVAGHVGAGLRIQPATTNATTSTIKSVELWADPETGVVLRVQISTGATAPAFETEFIDLDFKQPSAAVMQFDPTAVDEPVRMSPTVDPVEAVSSTPFIPLPENLAGLPRRNDATDGLGTYGQGLSMVTLFALPQGNLGRRVAALPRTERPWGGRAAVVTTSLINVQLVTIAGLDIVLSGTVTMAELDRIAAELAESNGLL